MALAFLCGVPLLLTAGNRRLSFGLTAALVVVIALLGFHHGKAPGYFDVTDDFFTPQKMVLGHYATSPYKEWEPIWVQESPAAPAPEKLLIM